MAKAKESPAMPGPLELQGGTIVFSPRGTDGSVSLVTIGSFDPVFSADEVDQISDFLDDVILAAVLPDVAADAAGDEG